MRVVGQRCAVISASNAASSTELTKRAEEVVDLLGRVSSLAPGFEVEMLRAAMSLNVKCRGRVPKPP
jgi:hypothetical protein